MSKQNRRLLPIVHQRQATAISFLLILVPAVGCHPTQQLPPNADPRVVEFRPIATRQRFSALVEAAEVQQAAEQKAGKPLTWEVRRSSKDTAPSGYWVDILPKSVDPVKSLPGVLVREIKPPNAEESTDSIWQVLLFLDPFNVNRADIEYARPSLDEHDRPCVEFSMTAGGAKKLMRLTAAHLPAGNDYCHLGIIVAGRLYSAPRINSAIGGDGVITGDFTKDEVRDIAAIITTVASVSTTASPSPTIR